VFVRVAIHFGSSKFQEKTNAPPLGPSLSRLRRLRFVCDSCVKWLFRLFGCSLNPSSRLFPDL